MNWRELLRSKISITIVTPAAVGIGHSTTPTVIEQDSPLIKRSNRSAFRFVEENKTDCFGKTVLIYYTQQFIHGRWDTMIQSLSTKKDEAMQLHLKLVERGHLNSDIITTVLWEGLDEHETKTWVTLNS